MSKQSLASNVAYFVARGHTVECAKLVVRYFVEKANKDTTLTLNEPKVQIIQTSVCDVTKKSIKATFGSK